MTFPIGLLTAFIKAVHTLYCYFSNGPRVDAALHFQVKEIKVIGPSPFSTSRLEPLNRYVVTGNYILALKNNSRHTAYLMSLENAYNLFNSFERIDPLVHLNPTETLKLKVSFSYSIDVTKKDVHKTPGIPPEMHAKSLIIKYQNEYRKDFFTKFKLSDIHASNSYHRSMPGD
jgi:hypothetical protein